jgi:hypothetical protein
LPHAATTPSPAAHSGRCTEPVLNFVNDPLYAGLKALQDKGNELKQQGNDLKTALASNGVQSSAESFTYTDWDAKGDWLSSSERGLGIARDALKLGTGVASASAGAGLVAGGCSSAVGCPLAAGAGAFLVGQGARDINAGVQGLLTPHEYEWGQNVYASLSGETYIRERDPLAETALALGVSAVQLGASLGISRLASGGNNLLSTNLRPKPEVPGTIANDVAESEVTVYRVFGGDARAQGFSWTTTDPRTVSNFRDAAGLPSGGPSGATNTADFLIQGKANTADILKSRSAFPLDGNKGGLPELVIDPKNVTITDFSVLKP